MNRYINIALNKFESVPVSLRLDPNQDIAAEKCLVDLARLYHHYYLDSYGRRPPYPDPSQFEYLRFLAETGDFRILCGGIGDSTAKKRHASTELGQAFCRWFLCEHLNITYFAHMDKVLDKDPVDEFEGFKVLRVENGDAPDYLCAENMYSVYLAEAKGRYKSINFKNKDFETWRKQFSRVEVRDKDNILRSVKGYIVGTRFAKEENSSSVKSGVFAEDPQSPGDLKLDDFTASQVYRKIQKIHFADIFEKLNQPLVAAALIMNSVISDQLRIQAVTWRLALDSVGQMEFVGGYWKTSPGDLPFSLKQDGSISTYPPDPFRLDHGRGVFIGLERKVFESVCRSVRTNEAEKRSIAQPIKDIPPFYSAISLLRDGSILGPAGFFIPTGFIEV
ncbi:hypothetical protein QT231_13140 [Halomonas sp. SpR1]|uniref:hypothetical protein n=1 Tax=Halomonas sp. SpR1 TaxID=3050462 RepID=UPI0027E564A6|nr:hypothetical protein [Halomonas sp. SpR1]MDQ7733650.1 hypothetical protein [Halomonas sp. SpR1]